MPTESYDTTTLRAFIIKHFDWEELQTLCQDIKVDFDSLRGEGKAGKARELVAHLERNSRLDDLNVVLEKKRPAAWQELIAPSLPSPNSVGDRQNRVKTGPAWPRVTLGLIMLIVIALLLFWLLSLVSKCTSPPTVTSTPTPTNTPILTPTRSLTPTIAITSPLTRVICPFDDHCYFPVEGTSSGIVSDPNLELIVFVRDGQWWPHKGFSFDEDETWHGRVLVGDERCWPIDYPFAIAVMVITKEQADNIPPSLQSLPKEYIARSKEVELTTTYAPVPIDLSFASASSPANSDITLTSGQTSLEINYSLGTNGWVLATVPINQDMLCMKDLGFSISFSFQGTGAANSLEVKLEDTDHTGYGWRRPRASVTANLETLEWPLDHFTFMGDGDDKDTDMNWQQVMNILFAIAQHPGDAGGAGNVTIRNVVIAPPVTP